MTITTPGLQSIAQEIYRQVAVPIIAPKEAEPREIVEWTEKFFYIPETLRPMRLAPYQKAILRHIFPEPPRPGLRYPYTTVVWSEPKKSGKSAIGAVVGRWAVETWGDFGEVYCCANDLEQSRGRNFAAIRQSIALPDLVKARDPDYTIPEPTALKMDEWDTPAQKPVLSYKYNGSQVTAISGDYRGAAGANPSFILFSELWGYISENSRRLYAEMTTVPTRLNSMRWVETYAGWLNESDLLWELYELGMSGEEVPELSFLRNPDGSPSVRRVPEARMFFFWSTKPRQPWQTDEYYDEQRQLLRPNEYRRFHHNEWVSRGTDFITPQVWDALESPAVAPLNELVQRLEPREKIELVLGVDASKNRDCTALVGVIPRENEANRHLPFVDLAFADIWTPEHDEELDKVMIDLVETVGKELERLHGDVRIDLKVVAYDPYQLHSIMTTFAKNSRVDVEEIPQTDRRVETDTCLLDMIQQNRLRTYRHPKLREHVLNAVAKERPRGIRLDKEATSQKIDAAVALAMAVWAALYYVPKKRRFVKV